MNLIGAELTESQFRKVSELIYQLSGIHLKTGKEALVRSRLMKRLRALKMSTFDEYLKYLESAEGKTELGHMVDVMTTNKTSFFREQEHFTYLKEKILPVLTDRKLRFWTTACSSGEEAYSLAIVLRECIPDIDMRDIKILATDISTRMLEKARKGIYTTDVVRDLPPQLLIKYFDRVQEGYVSAWQIKENVKKLIRIAWLNLMGPWPMKGLFDVIFCRNVMIYFDRPTQQRLIDRLWGVLKTGGYLFVGHSEGLSSISHKFRYIKPAIYQK